jgi:sugar phosphate isomerase/epimerase
MNKLLYSVLLLIVAITPLAAQKGKLIFPDKPGMVSYTYRKSLAKDAAATLDTIKSLGIVDMEFSSLFGKTAQEMRALLDARGIKCSSYGVGYDDLKNKMETVAQNAKALGASFVRVAWIPHQGDFTLAMAQKTVEDFNQFGKTLKDTYGLTFCYHNHGYEFQPYENGTLFDYIVQKTDPKYVSFEMDILWTFFPGQDPAALLNKYGNRFRLMHLKDLKKGVQGNMSGGTSPENDVPLGTGQLDIPAILIAARKAGVEHYYIEDESSNIATQVPQTLAYLKNLRK